MRPIPVLYLVKLASEYMILYAYKNMHHQPKICLIQIKMLSSEIYKDS